MGCQGEPMLPDILQTTPELANCSVQEATVMAGTWIVRGEGSVVCLLPSPMDVREFNIKGFMAMTSLPE